MKPWMKILMWVGLGFGLGFFAGERVGSRISEKEIEQVRAEAAKAYGLADAESLSRALELAKNSVYGLTSAKFDKMTSETARSRYYEAAKAMNDYRGDTDGDKCAPVPSGIQTVEEIDMVLRKPATDEEDIPEMVTAEELEQMQETLDDDRGANIRQLHPTHILPEIVSEEEFYQNLWEYEEEKLLWYEGDEVLYNATTQSIIEQPENVIGEGTLYEFRAGVGEPKDTIYVINEIYGTRFRIDRLDGFFNEEVDRNIHPDDDDIDDDDDIVDDD